MSRTSRARTVLRDAVTAAVVYLVALGRLFLAANTVLISNRRAEVSAR